MRDPFRVQECTFKDPLCIVDPRSDCSQQGHVYICTCSGCSEEILTSSGANHGTTRSNQPGGEHRPNYVGMTGTSMHARGLSHLKEISAKLKSNALYNHILTVHGGQIQTFTMRPMSSHRTTLGRYKMEAVTIEHQVRGTSMNQKTEGGRGGLVRIDLRIQNC